MKRLATTFCLTALAIAACIAQAQDTSTPIQNMSVSEFRQTLTDLGSYLDAHKGTNISQQFSALTDQQLQVILPSVPDTRKLQTAVAGLKQNDVLSPIQSKLQTSRIATRGIASVVQNQATTCARGTIIDDDGSAGSCRPAYPDPNNSAWRNMVNPIITFGGFSPTDYASVSSQQCDLTVESNLVQVVSALNGTVTVASIACSALQAIPVGGTIASGVCDVAVALVGVAGAVSQGLLADCSEQDGNVNSAEIDAAFHNTVTIYDKLGAVNTQITGEFNTASTQLTNVDTDIDIRIANLDTHLTNVDNHVAAEFVTLDAHITTLIGNLATQLTNSTALLNADLRQVMKLELTPDGQRIINPLILTCNGTNCPNVLAKCPAAGCSWNNAGPLP